MKRHARSRIGAAVALVLLGGCSSSSPSGSGPTDSGGAQDACSAQQANTGDGTSACGTTTCSAGTYCYDSFASSCLEGCTAGSNCSPGDYCDSSNATQDAMGKHVGTCRAPCTSSPAPVEAGACPDVHGVYGLALDTARSSTPCAQAVPNTTCTIVQSTCALAWSCSPSNGFMTSNVDGNGQSQLTVPVPGGGTAACVVVFGGGSLTWDCQFAGQGTAIDCKGTGTRQ